LHTCYLISAIVDSQECLSSITALHFSVKSCCIIYGTMKSEAAKAIVLILGFIVILLIIHYDNKSTVFAQNLANNSNNFFLANGTFIKSNNMTDYANMSSLSDDYNIEGTINGQISTKSEELATNKNNQTSVGGDVPVQLYLLGGKLRLDVSKGYVKYFKANITMITTTGNEIHEHLIIFKPYTAGIALLTNNSATTQNMNMTSNNSSISRIGYNSIVFSGVADIITNGIMQWIDVPISVSILNDKVITIELNSSRIDNHFFDAPIYGIVSTIEPLASTQKK
jgi:hypothetical protein